MQIQPNQVVDDLETLDKLYFLHETNHNLIRLQLQKILTQQNAIKVTCFIVVQLKVKQSFLDIDVGLDHSYKTIFSLPQNSPEQKIFDKIEKDPIWFDLLKNNNFLCFNCKKNATQFGLSRINLQGFGELLVSLIFFLVKFFFSTETEWVYCYTGVPICRLTGSCYTEYRWLVRMNCRKNDGECFNTCDNCRRYDLTIVYKRCSKCKLVTYCSVKCQKKDWINHEKTCKKNT
jgi:hypothetical protein